MVFYVITATSLRYKLIRHKAIMYNDGHQDMVLHKSEQGVFLIPLPSFLAQGRQILKQEEHQCESMKQITDYYVAHVNDSFNLFTNNCEQFVNNFLSEVGETVIIKSPQRDFIFLSCFGIGGLLAYYTAKKLGWKPSNLLRNIK